jgi:hypothetical protein
MAEVKEITRLLCCIILSEIVLKFHHGVKFPLFRYLPFLIERLMLLSVLDQTIPESFFYNFTLKSGILFNFSGTTVSSCAKFILNILFER